MSTVKLASALASAAALILIAAPSAQATCMIQCTAELMFDDCTKPPSATAWPASETLTVSGSCEACCSPPGGPVVCEPEPLTANMLALQTDGNPLNGLFSAMSVACSPDPLFVWSGLLSPGSYDLATPDFGMILLQFEVVEAGCVADPDCPACNVCLGGVCKGLGVPICANDDDCGEDEKCLVNLAAPCANHCVPKDAECATYEDCPICNGCVEGQCIPSGLLECAQDSDCADGQVCDIDPVAACKNHCVDAPPECATSDDCGLCAACVGGECKGLGVIMCETDDDCADGQSCQVDATDACKNQCVDATPECVTSDDCGPCAGCVGGECKGLGAVMCETDDDCAEGQACQVDGTDACMNQCVQAIGDDIGGPEADAGSGGDTGGPEADAGSQGDATAGGDAQHSDTAVLYGEDALDAPTGSSGDSTGCAAAPGAQSGALALLLAAALFIWRRRTA